MANDPTAQGEPEEVVNAKTVEESVSVVDAEALDSPKAESLPLPATAIREGSDPVPADVVDANIIFFGLDNAGKSTIMQVLANDRLVVQQPTLHPSALEVVINKIRFKAFDLAGHETGRRLWKEYFPIASAVLFLVDAADRSRFREAAEELSCLLSTPALQAVPIAVLGMKTDIKGSASEDEFCKEMLLTHDKMGFEKPWVSDNVKVFMCSAVEMNGCHRIGDAVNWLSAHILKHRAALAVVEVVPVAAKADDDDVDMMV